MNTRTLPGPLAAVLIVWFGGCDPNLDDLGTETSLGGTVSDDDTHCEHDLDCQEAERGQLGDDVGDGSPCHPLSLETCCLPMPSNTYDADSVDGCLPEEVLRDLPDSFRPSKLLEGRDGWSPSAPVLFEAPYEVDAGALPLDGGDVLKVYDRSSPAKSTVPVRVRLSQIAELQDSKPGADPNAKTAQVIEALPRSRFPFGHRLVAVLTTALPRADGGTVEAVELPPIYDDVVADLGLSRDEILSITEFTVSTEENTTGKLFEMIDVVKSQSHEIKDLRADWTPLMPDGRILRGTVELTNFRAEDGTIDFETGDQGEFVDTGFDLYIPGNARFGSVPLVIYGHPLAGNRSDAAPIAYLNARSGVATIMIDWPNHGPRVDEDAVGRGIYDNNDPEHIGHLAGMWAQGVIDMHSLLTAVKKHIVKHSDLLPILPIPLLGGTGKPDIDISRIHFMGTSLGGIIGSGFVGSSDEIGSAYLQVGGTGIHRQLSLSKATKTGFNNLFSDELNGPESTVLAYMLQLNVDVGDGNNLIHNVRPSGPYGHETPLVLQYGIGDSIVTNDNSLALAELANLPVILPELESVSYLEQSWHLVDGYGLFQSDPLAVAGPFKSLAKPLADSLFDFLRPVGADDYDHFMHLSCMLTPRGWTSWGRWLLSTHSH